MWHKRTRNKIHRGKFDEHHVKIESTTVEMFREVEMLLFMQNIQDLNLGRRICSTKK
jgi:hypothetical protein